MGKLKSIKEHIVKGTIIKRLKYQFSPLKKWEDFKKSKKDFLIHRLDKGIKLKLYKDSYLSYLIIRGDFEVNEISFFKRYLNKSDNIIDIGGNIGLFTCLAAVKAKEIHSFEPTPYIFNRLKENVDLNQLENCKLYNQALGSTNEILSLNVSINGMDAWNTLGKVPNESDFKKVEVDCIKLDTFFEKNQWPVSHIQFIKMDVEGWEMNVIKGASNVFSAKDAPDLLIEITDENLNQNQVNGNQVLNELKSLGYHLYELTTNQLKPHTIQEKYEYCNIFCSKNKNELIKRGVL